MAELTQAQKDGFKYEGAALPGSVGDGSGTDLNVTSYKVDGLVGGGSLQARKLEIVVAEAGKNSFTLTFERKEGGGLVVSSDRPGDTEQEAKAQNDPATQTLLMKYSRVRSLVDRTGVQPQINKYEANPSAGTATSTPSAAAPATPTQSVNPPPAAVTPAASHPVPASVPSADNSYSSSLPPNFEAQYARLDAPSDNGTNAVPAVPAQQASNASTASVIPTASAAQPATPVAAGTEPQETAPVTPSSSAGTSAAASGRRRLKGLNLDDTPPPSASSAPPAASQNRYMGGRIAARAGRPDSQKPGAPALPLGSSPVSGAVASMVAASVATTAARMAKAEPVAAATAKPETTTSPVLPRVATKGLTINASSFSRRLNSMYPGALGGGAIIEGTQSTTSTSSAPPREEVTATNPQSVADSYGSRSYGNNLNMYPATLGVDAIINGTQSATPALAPGQSTKQAVTKRTSDPDGRRQTMLMNTLG